MALPKGAHPIKDGGIPRSDLEFFFSDTRKSMYQKKFFFEIFFFFFENLFF